MNSFFRLSGLVLISSSLLALSGCSSTNTEAKYPTGANRSSTNDDIYAKPDSIFGEGGISLFNKKKDKEEESGIGVNSYLWRAALDTVSFMPLNQADPFGGVITTDWYTPSDTPNERLKVNVLILSKSLKSDGVRVRVFKQQNAGGIWTDIAVSELTSRELEDAILTRARQLRVADIE